MHCNAAHREKTPPQGESRWLKVVEWENRVWVGVEAQLEG